MKIISILVVLLSFLGTSPALGDENAISLTGTWKFHLGDNPEWINPAFPDSQWDFIGVPQIWENAGYGDYDGYAWYRKSVMIPAEWRNNKYVKLKNHLYLQLGEIDDVDQTFINGYPIGSTGSFPPDFISGADKPRTYEIPLHIIRWGEANFIAIRVYDQEGKGGIFTGNVALKPPNQIDYVNFTTKINSGESIYRCNQNLSVDATIENNSFDPLIGNLDFEILTDEKISIQTASYPVHQTIGKQLTFSTAFRLRKPGIYILKSTFSHEDDICFSTEKLLGCDVLRMIATPDQERDFVEFWQRTKQQLSQIPLQTKIEKIDTLCTDSKDVYSARILAFDDIYIYGWYVIPNQPVNCPVILEFPGYSNRSAPRLDGHYDNFAVLSLDIRGHGRSRGEIKPSFPGYLVWNIDNKEKYIYRGAFMDCLRAVDFLFSRPEVDTSRIAVCGTQQGGGLALVAAALDPRIKLVIADSPFLANFQAAVKIAFLPYNEIIQYIVEHPTRKRSTLKNLSYFDALNFANNIRCPVLMSLTLNDRTCPPRTCFAVYNQIGAEKEYVVFSNKAERDGSPDYETYKTNWIKSRFKIR
ncbi:acetylxylan esterase [candidate division KSB1 bacterium]|nr:acetylxylan esterase [candidate division KSB1 bacterium]